MKKFVCFLLLAGISIVSGAENQWQHERGSRRFNHSGNSFRGGRNFQNGSNRGGFLDRFVREAEMARKFPAEFAEVEAMREKYEAALAALAEKAEVQLPETMDSRIRKLRKNNPAEFDAAMQKMKDSPMEAMKSLQELAKRSGIELFRRPAGRGGADHGENAMVKQVRSFNRPDMAALRRKYPEKMKEYELLRGREPAKAREFLLEIIKQDQRTEK